MDQMHITATAHPMTAADVGLWDALRSYLNLPVPLSAVLRRPYAFLRQGDAPPENANHKSATILPLRSPETTAGDDKET
ncbi:hypothetical protein SM22010_02355 [Xanthomonas hortorum pv. gardneri]|nr:hypothetical protein BJD10_23090 [Xanthomonas hortorum pv. gardneri]KLB06746.1 hypothetical protein SM18210_00570 [Xanthomonas hortorum pv. gardneri]KLB12037.1 hypothetical protein SM23410_03805 [Xanthomonas hortorum pv. gardneri]KLB14448.1 hypothetical protein SM22010_02355 [Xanthomonas hortorum pv. gardneri]KLB19544.1 hypothetical protein SM60511_09860 [Xanthomonas hortorum pv. gardneri]